MKRFYLIFIALLAISISALAEDFSVANSDGKTIYYNIIGKGSVEVTYRGLRDDTYDNEYSGSVNIPSSVVYNNTTYAVTSIGASAFRGCSGLTSVTIPNSVTSIGDWAFLSCSGLTSISIPSSVTSIGQSVFSGCSGLTSVTIPSSVTSIGQSAFKGCSGLTSVTIPSSVTSIGQSVFSGCSGLTSVTIPSSVTTLGDSAFYGCSNFNSFKILNPSLIYKEVDVLKSNLDTIVAPASFFDVTQKDLELTCEHVKYMAVNGGEISKGGFAFINRQKTSISKLLLDGATNTSIPNESFSKFYMLDSLSLPAGLINIPDMCAAYCMKLSNTVIPATVMEIGVNAFYGCAKFDEIIIPSSVMIMGDDAFALCTGVKKITSNAIMPPIIEAKTFSQVPKNTPVYVPVDVVNDYRSAQYWKDMNIQAPIITDVDNVTDVVSDFVISDGALIFDVPQVVSVFSTSGVCIFSGVAREVALPYSGVFIVVPNNAKAFKVVNP